MAPRRALWVVSVSNMAGVARHVVDVADAGIEGWDLSFLLPEGPLAHELRARGAAVDTNEFGKRHGTLASVRALRKVISRDSPQIVHSHLAWADIIAAMARSSDIRLLSTEHGVAPGNLYHQRRFRRALTRTVHRARVHRTDAIIAVSRATAAVAEDTWGRPRSGVFDVVPNGVDGLSTAAQDIRSGTRFGCLARLAPEKDFGTLLAAFQRVLERLPAASLDIAGTGELEPWLRAEIGSRGLASAVRLRGFMEPEQFFREVDVVVQLSLWENCSYSVLDAIVRGKGLVATEVGGYLEYLPSRCLVPVGDTTAAAQRMVEQTTDLALRPRLPSDWPTVSDMTRQIARVYSEVMASRPRPARASTRRPRQRLVDSTNLSRHP